MRECESEKDKDYFERKTKISFLQSRNCTDDNKNAKKKNKRVSLIITRKAEKSCPRQIK